MKLIDLGDGNKVEASNHPRELDTVKVIDKQGNEKPELFGTVIAMTNGAILELL